MQSDNKSYGVLQFLVPDVLKSVSLLCRVVVTIPANDNYPENSYNIYFIHISYMLCDIYFVLLSKCFLSHEPPARNPYRYFVEYIKTETRNTSTHMKSIYTYIYIKKNINLK